VVADRLGSVRWRKAPFTAAERTNYYPYGEERPGATAQERDKFGTYYRDATGLDYADQRYYQSQWGRFMSADPYVASAGVEGPRSWNRYSYVEGDPVNAADPSGLAMNCLYVGGMFTCTTVQNGGSSVGGAPGGLGSGGGGSSDSHPQLMALPDQDIVNGASGGLVSIGATINGITIENIRFSAAVANAIDRLKGALENDTACSNWLGSSWLGSSKNMPAFLDVAKRVTAIGDFNLSSNAQAVTVISNTGGGTLISNTSVSTVISSDGFFFNNVVQGSQQFGFDGNTKVQSIVGGTEAAKRLTLLHEFGHYLGIPGFKQRDDDPSMQAINNDEIMKNCERTIFWK